MPVNGDRYLIDMRLNKNSSNQGKPKKQEINAKKTDLKEILVPWVSIRKQQVVIPLTLKLLDTFKLIIEIFELL